MSTTKYVMDGRQRFVMINKYSGLDHSQLALLLEDEPVSAGFIYHDINGIQAYGQSISLGIRSREEDTSILVNALESGLVSASWDDVTDNFFAGNITHISMQHGNQTIEDLIAKKIITS